MAEEAQLTKVRVIDFETTGLSAAAKVIEVGYTDLMVEGSHREIVSQHQELCNPEGTKIELEALAVHHIQDIQLENQRPCSVVLRELEDSDVDFWVAHNAAYERKFIQPKKGKWICTMKVGHKLWPDSPRHTNQVLRYYLGLSLLDELAMPPHRALPDTYVTAWILMKALDQMSLEEMAIVTGQPVLLQKVHFGKHAGTNWSEVPKDYLRWILNNGSFDEDVTYTARHYLKVD